MDLKQTLACTALLLAISGCQSGAGSSSWKWWGGAQKAQSVSSSELAGSPYDGVALPSAQVQPPKVPEGKSAAKKSLATIPPGTSTPDAYVSTIEQSTKSASPTYPSTPYPSTPYSNTLTQNAGRNEVPGSAAPNAATPSPAKPRYPATGFAAGSPQPTYPTTSVDSTPDPSPVNSRPLAQDGRGPSSGTYGFNAPTTGNTGPNPEAAGTGPRYSSNVGAFAAGTPSAGPSVVPPANAQFPTASTSPPSNPLGPRYATLPGERGGSRYDARPASPLAGTMPPASPSAPSSPSTNPGVRANVRSPSAGNNQAGRYPQSVVPRNPAAGSIEQVDFTPFRPGSTSRYVPNGTKVAPTVPGDRNNYQSDTPYNPPATDRP
jgi:hypothetical protein